MALSLIAPSSSVAFAKSRKASFLPRGLGIGMLLPSWNYICPDPEKRWG